MARSAATIDVERVGIGAFMAHRTTACADHAVGRVRRAPEEEPVSARRASLAST